MTTNMSLNDATFTSSSSQIITGEHASSHETISVKDAIVDKCEQASAKDVDVEGIDGASDPASDADSMCTADREAKYAREDAEAEALLCQSIDRLCKQLWPPPKTLRHRLTMRLRQTRLGRTLVPTPDEPVIKRMEGGDVNSITAITLPPLYAKESPAELILRIPNFKWTNECRMDRDVAILNYARKHSDIPVPAVVSFDATSQNTLEKPYMLQQRVPGTTVNNVWDTLNTTQRCQLAKQLGQVNKTLRTITHQNAGLIEPIIDPQRNESFKIVRFEVEQGEREDEEPPEQEPRAPQTTLDVFITQLTRWQASNGDWPGPTETYPKLLTCVREMDSLGCFATQSHCLCHVDLHENNVMISIDPNDLSVKITGVLDWDEAIFAPQFVNCRPPAWLWLDEEELQTDEQGYDPWPYEMPGSGETPNSAEANEIKRTFEENAGGEEYRAMAYGDVFRLGRALWRIAKEGLDGQGQPYKAADKVVEEWAVLREKMLDERAEKGEEQRV